MPLSPWVDSVHTMTVSITTAALEEWSRACVQALGVARAEIDALNVFPVADNDTGTNVYLTFEAAAAALAEPMRDEASLPQCAKTYVDASLLGARGNSGVIMSQLLRAMFRALVRARGELRPEHVADALTQASRAAYAAVGEPVEGTILTVSASAAEAAVRAAEEGLGVEEVLSAAAREARAALARTPDQLDRLCKSGVVDAGGRALVVVLDTTERVLTGRWNPEEATPGTSTIPVPIETGDLDADGPAYEVMYLLDAEDDSIPPLREALGGLGDSLVVVGGERLWNVHVHVDDVGAAIEAGIAAGRPYRIAVTHFVDQQRATRERHAGDRERRAVVATAAGPGLAALFENAGADVLEFRLGDDLTVARILDVIERTGAHDVIVLPNSSDYVAVCEAAAARAREGGMRVSVVPTNTQVQGLSALAVHQPGLGFDEDVIAMTSAAGHTHHGAVTIAEEAGITMAGPCRPGDVLGVVEGEFAVIGNDQTQVALEVLSRLLSGSAELVTIVSGADVDEAAVRALEQTVRTSRPDVDSVVYDGGQQRYRLLLAVE